MEFLGVGPSELIFVVIIALIILGPKDMQKAGKTIGKFLRNVVTSDGWKLFQQTSRELRTLPNRLMRDANEEMNKIGNELNTNMPDLKKADNTSSRMKDPNIPPFSQPISTTPSETKSESPATAPTPNESDQPKDA